MGGPLRILLVEDAAADAELALAELRRAGIDLVALVVDTGDAFRAALRDFSPDLILSDYALPQFSGLAALELAREAAPEVPFIILTGSLNEETAVGCMKAGAWDYLLKDRRIRLPLAVRGALELARARRERAAAVEDLRRREAQLRLITDTAPVLISYIDRDLRYREVNRRYETWFGAPAESLRGRSVEEVLGAAVWPKVRAYLERALAGVETSFNMEAPFPAVGTRWMSVTYTPDRDDAGSVRGIVALLQDVTGQKRIEDALRESEKRYRSLFEQSPIGIYRTTPDGQILLANPALVRMLGYSSAEELYAKNLEDQGFDPRYPRRRFQDAVERSGELRGFEAVWPRKDGTELFVEENATAIRDATGSVLCYEGTVEDMTARRQAEGALRLLATAVDQSAEAVVVTDPKGVIEYVNPAFARITGWESAEVLGKTPAVLKSGRHDDAFYQDLWGTILTGNVWAGRLTNQRKDGSLYEEEMTISPVRDPKGEIIRFVAVKRDVTREVMLQQQLNQAQKMEAIGRLAGGIAHDFNNLLQALMSQLEVLRRSAIGGESGRPFAEVDQLVTRGAALTRQLLLFARKETSVAQDLELNEVVRSATTLLRRIVRENVAIEVAAAEVALPVRADRGQIEQVLMNLVVNASDAMAEGGRVVIATGGDAGEVWLAVSDTGHGIPEDIQPLIFDPFFTTKPAGKGTGLGLSVVHGIVASHGGRIDVSSAVGAGTAFRVVLPRAAASTRVAAAARPAPMTPPGGSGERILVVEDEEGARLGLSELLSLLGYTVATASSAEEALAFPSEPRFDVVLSDLSLPGMAGTELVQRLKQQWPGLKVVLMSGYTADEALRSTVASGRIEFLQKPFDANALAEVLRRVIESPGELAE